MTKNSDDENLSQIYATENPINDFKIDHFGYKKVAKELAANIIQLDSKSGYVIAINGKWGSGKSSFLFYTKQYLTDYRKELDIPHKEHESIIFNFDPWLFSGHQDIVSQFFTQMKAQVEICPTKISQNTMKILNRFFSYGSHLKKVPTLGGQISGWAFTGLNAIIESKIESSVKSILEIKQEIIKELQKSDEKIVIIIDDIDRLTSDEIRELFRAMKAIADFPNIIYLLAFDEDIVISALNYEFCSTHNDSRSGLKYLEKIVQFTIPLPMIGENQLKEYTEKIIFDEKFNDTTSSLIESTRWTDIYHNGLRHFLKTPRNVIRLNNALRMLYPSVKNEVNVVDFVSLLVIRLNYPELYNHIKDDHRFFIIDSSIESLYFNRDQRSEVLTKMHTDWITSKIIQEDQKSIAFILASLFPEISPYIQHLFTKSSVYTVRTPKMLNISYNYDTFLKYFRLQTEPDLFSNTELSNILDSVDNPDTFAEFVARLNDRSSRVGSKALTFFESILPLIDEGTPKLSLENLVIGIFKIQNNVLNNKNISSSGSIFSKNIFDFIGSVLYKAMAVIPKEKRLELLKKAYSMGTAFSLEAELIIVLRQLNGDWEGVEPKIPTEVILPPSELKEIEDIYVNRVQTAFLSDAKNFSSPYLGDIIFVWNKLNPNDPKLIDAIEKIWESDNILITIIHSSRAENYLEPILPYSLEPIKSEEEFREKVKNILQTKEIKGSEKTSLEDFLKTKKRIKFDSKIDSMT